MTYYIKESAKNFILATLVVLFPILFAVGLESFIFWTIPSFSQEELLVAGRTLFSVALAVSIFKTIVEVD